MTQLASAPTAAAPTSRRWIPSAALVSVAAILLVAVAYVVHFGGCDTQSRFCYVGLAGTRSEAVVAWLDGFEVYTQTYPAE